MADEEQEKKEEEQESEEVFKKDKMTEEKVKSPRVPRQPKTIQIKVTLLDNTLYECELDVRTPTLSSVTITKGFRKLSQLKPLRLRTAVNISLIPVYVYKSECACVCVCLSETL